MAGCLIVIEGIDGGGKTTLRSGLARWLAGLGHEAVETKEPTDGPIGKQIRSLAATGRDSVAPMDELLLFERDRKQHVHGLVRPALARGACVVQDRSYFSTVAYQGARGLDRPMLLARQQKISPKPDVLLVVDVPAEIALERIRKSRGVVDDFERLDALEALRQVFVGFEGAILLDGNLPPDQVLEAAKRAIQPVLERPLAPVSGGGHI